MQALSPSTTITTNIPLSEEAARLAHAVEMVASELEGLRRRAHTAGLTDWTSAAAARFRDRLLERERSLLRTEGLLRTAAAGVADFSRSLAVREAVLGSSGSNGA